MTLRLYSAYGSVGLTAHLVAEESGLEYDAIILDMKAGDQLKPDYLAVNPKGRFPTLITDRGPISEIPAIIYYLASLSDRNLLPSDSYELAQAMSFNGYLTSTVHVAHAHRFRGSRWATKEASIEDMVSKVTENMTECAAMIEQNLFTGPWVMGEQYTVCDLYLLNVIGWMIFDGVDITQFPALKSFNERIKERPAVASVLALYA